MNKSRTLKKRFGFTMLELIVVIVILGVIAGLAVPSFLSVTTKSKYAVAAEEARGEARKAIADASFNKDFNGTLEATFTGTSGDCTVDATVTGGVITVETAAQASCEGGASATAFPTISWTAQQMGYQSIIFVDVISSDDFCTTYAGYRFEVWYSLAGADSWTQDTFVNATDPANDGEPLLCVNPDPDPMGEYDSVVRWSGIVQNFTVGQTAATYPNGVLSPETAYDIRVRTIAPGGETSAWSYTSLTTASADFGGK